MENREQLWSSLNLNFPMNFNIVQGKLPKLESSLK